VGRAAAGVRCVLRRYCDWDGTDRRGEVGLCHKQKVRRLHERFRTLPAYYAVLWFDSNAEEAVDFYLTVFKNSRRLDELRNVDDGPPPKGGILTIAFELDGQKFTALNGGPHFKFTEAVSFVMRCDTQQEVDEYWSKLSEGDGEVQCGWVKDKFGLSWQNVPAPLPEPVKHPKAMQAMMKMTKLDIAELERAAQS
jgi:predicted 3-demethylubiquinone-9 3-methyltransferase (glyoxalase superfamily)